MILLAINWSEVGVKAAEFVVSFSIIVVLHELGHFLPAKWFKCRVEKFYLFFNPWFSLVKKKVGETEYGLGWVPFGGYVKISGMIDESMDKDSMKLPPKPYEFRSKPAWQRLIIMIGGVTVNLLLGFFLFAMILWHYGETYLPPDGQKYGIAADSLGRSIGFKNGDRVLNLDGEPVKDFDRVWKELVMRDIKFIEVERSGKNVKIPIPEDFSRQIIRLKDIKFINTLIPFKGIDSVLKGSPAEKAGLVKHDEIISINGIPTPIFNIFQEEVSKNRNKEVTLVVVKGSDTTVKKTKIPADAILGVTAKIETDLMKIKTDEYTFLKAIPAGFDKSLQTLEDNWLQLKMLFSKKVKTSESLGSVISIGKMYPGKWNWEAVWNLTAFFSLVLALMNILPIPALDGGHAMFTIYEMITGRKPSDKFIEYAQMIGMILLLGITAYALGLDIFRLFK